MAEKKAKKKASNNAVEWDFTLKAPAVITIEGVISANTGNSLILNSKREGSSLRRKLVVPKSKVIYVEGALTEGSEAKIIYQHDLAPIGRKMRRMQIDEIADKDTGFLKGVNEKGVSVLINPNFASDLVTSKESTIEAPAGATVRKTSKKSSKK